MKITIVGGGNIGTQFAVHCAHKGHEVTLFSSKPERFGTTHTTAHLSSVSQSRSSAKEQWECLIRRPPHGI